MNPRRYLPVVAMLLAVAGCDFKETRSGNITLTAGSAGIPLNGKAGPATLVAGRAEITFKKGSSDKSIAIRVKQSGRPDVELEAPVSKGYESGNFTLKGAEIGQPVDMASARAYAVTGPVERYTTWESQGSQECLVEVSYQPCDENWTVGFKSTSGADLGSFASRTAYRCNEYRRTQFCRRDPREPHFPRGEHGGRYWRSINELGADGVKFD